MVAGGEAGPAFTLRRLAGFCCLADALAARFTLALSSPRTESALSSADGAAGPAFTLRRLAGFCCLADALAARLTSLGLSSPRTESALPLADGAAGPAFTRTYGYPGSEIDLLGRGALPAGWLSGTKARLLLSLLLRKGLSREEAESEFRRYVAD